MRDAGCGMRDAGCEMRDAVDHRSVSFRIRPMIMDTGDEIEALEEREVSQELGGRAQGDLEATHELRGGAKSVPFCDIGWNGRSSPLHPVTIKTGKATERTETAQPGPVCRTHPASRIPLPGSYASRISHLACRFVRKVAPRSRFRSDN